MRSLQLLVLLGIASSCSHQPPAASVVLESNSEAVGADGKLVQSIGIETLGGVFSPVLQKGCVLPCAVTNIFSTAEDNQQHLVIRAFRGTCDMAKDCHSLGTVRLSGFSAGPRGEPQVSVVFRADEEGVTLSAFEAGSSRTLDVVRIVP